MLLASLYNLKFARADSFLLRYECWKNKYHHDLPFLQFRFVAVAFAFP